MKHILKSGEGRKADCFLCKEPLDGDVFWTVIQSKKEIRVFSCPKCGQDYMLEKNVLTDCWEIDKKCPCKISLSLEDLSGSLPKWRKTKYFYCDKCFSEAFGNILFENLGDKSE